MGWEVKEHEHQDCFKKSGDPLTVKWMIMAYNQSLEGIELLVCIMNLIYLEVI